MPRATDLEFRFYQAYYGSRSLDAPSVHCGEELVPNSVRSQPLVQLSIANVVTAATGSGPPGVMIRSGLSGGDIG